MHRMGHGLVQMVLRMYPGLPRCDSVRKPQNLSTVVSDQVTVRERVAEDYESQGGMASASRTKWQGAGHARGLQLRYSA